MSPVREANKLGGRACADSVIRTSCPYLRGNSNVGPLLLLPGVPQGQRWFCDAVPAASGGQRCCRWSAARQHQRATDAVTVGGTGLLAGCRTFGSERVGQTGVPGSDPRFPTSSRPPPSKECAPPFGDVT